MNILMDLIIPKEELVTEIPNDSPVMPFVFGAAVALIAVFLVVRAVKNKK